MSHKTFKRHLITSALPYANGPVHIGHLAGVYVPSDIYTRYLRLKGEDVVHVCGSDEHGVPITIKARQQGIRPQELVDKYHTIIKEAFEGLGISFDIYSRTSSITHHQTASEFFKTLHAAGKFVEKTTEQYYDEEAGQFLADRYIQGTCPHCGNDAAYGDQCEKCGTSLNATDLINPHSVISGNPPIMKETSHWFLPLEAYQSFLEQWILKDHTEWKSNVYGQCKSWLDMGLQARAVSRDLDWGVPVPVPGAEGKVLYVWFDAPIGYISNTKELLPNSWEKYWKDDQTRMIHFIGKDNIVFHCIVFPSMLKAHQDFILPENVPANEFLNLENDKISTSRNWAVWLHEYLQDFPGQQDVLRYTICANAPETKDNNFTWKDFQDRNNNELVAIFGNFVNRAVVLTHKYFGGKVPAAGAHTDFDLSVLNEMAQFKKKVEDNLDAFRFREALKEAMNLARLGNKYLADTEPWKVIKTDEDRVKTILNISIQIVANLTIIMDPFMPFTTQKLRSILGVGGISASGITKTPEVAAGSEGINTAPASCCCCQSPIIDTFVLCWDRLGRDDLIEVGHALGEATLLFEKIEDNAIELQLQKLEATKLQNRLDSAQAPAQKDPIQFEDFEKADIRVVTILEAEKVAKTKKLMKMLVDTGLDQRTVVSGVAEYFEPHDLIGKQVCMLINLAPRSIKGIVSQGMILYAENADGSLKLMQPELEVNKGSVVK